MYHLHVFQDSIIITFSLNIGAMCHERKRRFQSDAIGRNPPHSALRLALVSTANVDSRPIGKKNRLQSTPATAQLTGSRLLRSSAHAEARAGRESERSDFRQRLNGRIHTQSYVKIPVLASILVNTVGYVLS